MKTSTRETREGKVKLIGLTALTVGFVEVTFGW